MQTDELPDVEGHEACNETIQKLLQVIQNQKELLETTLASLDNATKTISDLKSLIVLAPARAQAKSGRGRPKNPVDGARLLQIFNDVMLPEFMACHPTVIPSDKRVLTWYFTKEYARYGWSASRVRGKVFQGKLKTLQNRLSDVRNPVPKLPIK